MSQEILVSLERHGAIIDLDMESAALGRLHIDNDALPEDERAGSAKKLLGASVLYCYIAALDKALEARGARYDKIAGKASVTAGSDDKGALHPRHCSGRDGPYGCGTMRKLLSAYPGSASRLPDFRFSGSCFSRDLQPQT